MNAHRLRAELERTQAYRVTGPLGADLHGNGDFVILAEEIHTIVQYRCHLAYTLIVDRAVPLHIATKEFAADALAKMRQLGVVEDIQYGAINAEDDFNLRLHFPGAGWELRADAWVTPHDAARRAFDARGARDHRTWQERLDDIVGMTERIANVKVLDIYYRDSQSREDFDELMAARTKLHPWEWKQLAGRDHYRNVLERT